MMMGSLFSGIGGIELGLENEGFTTAWMVENDAYAKAVLTKRFPYATLYDDITKLDFNLVHKVDLITGGFPCQDISNAGSRDGITGSRSSLWSHYKRALMLVRPRYALIENVAALLARGLDVVLLDLAQIGYDAEWHCVPASAVGAPHQRDRVFIIAHASGLGQLRGLLGGGGHDQADTEQHATTSEQAGKGREREPSKTGRNEITWWAAEPELGRVAHGIPHRVDRIKCLGNAVVPQVAQAIGKVIK